MMEQGMTFELFWEGELNAVNDYIEVAQKRQKSAMMDMDRQAWLIGSYVLQALGAAFSGKNNKQKYPQQPKMMDAMKTQEEKNIEAYQKLKAFSDGWRGGKG